MIAGNKTKEILSYLQTNFRDQAELSVCFPKEEPDLDDIDIVISEKELPALTQALYSMESPPLLIVLKSGKSNQNILYTDNFCKDFPEAFSSLQEKEPILCFLDKNETYVYLQKEVVSIHSGKFLTIHLRSGEKLISHEGVRKVAARLSPNYFFRVGDKIFLNALYVSEFLSDGIRMQNGMLIPCEESLLKKAENNYYKTRFFQNFPKNVKKKYRFCENPKKKKKF